MTSTARPTVATLTYKDGTTNPVRIFRGPDPAAPVSAEIVGLVGELVEGRVTLYSTTTREETPYMGRITTLIENGDLERAADLELTPEHSRVMLCGNPQMIEDTRAVLKALDMNLALTRRPGQVAVENYW